MNAESERWLRFAQEDLRMGELALQDSIYDLSQISDHERNILAALADFALYAGVGGKTTQDMGQCRRI